MCLLLPTFSSGFSLSLSIVYACQQRDCFGLCGSGMPQGVAFLHAHKQLHRDIKPGNLLMSNDGVVKLADFGIAKQLENTASLALSFVGTTIYMSPERIGGSSMVSPPLPCPPPPSISLAPPDKSHSLPCVCMLFMCALIAGPQGLFLPI